MAGNASFQDVVVLIPGILGSRLVRREGRNEVTVWDFSITSLPRVLRELAGGRLQTSMLEGPPLDGITAVDLYTYQWLPGFFGVDDYRPLARMVAAAVTDARQFIPFPYDWRASNRYAAERLQTVALDALTRWQKESGAKDSKLWLVCHSMGGLVARYFCEHLDGARHTKAIITFGTPHRGATKALNALANGMCVGPLNLTDLVRSLPSIYELLPLFPVVRLTADQPLRMHRLADFFGLDAVTGADLSTPSALPPIAGLDRQMLKQALQFHAAIRVPAERRAERGVPTPYRQEAFINRRQPTTLSARLEGHVLQMVETYPYDRGHKIVDEDERGDGTVPSFASVPIEWSDSEHAHAVAEKHAAMQCAANALDNTYNWLRPLDVRAKKGSAFDDRNIVALKAPQVITAGDDLIVDVAAPAAMALTVEVFDVERETAETQQVLLPGEDVVQHVRFRPPIAGVHRVSAIPTDRMLPRVSDYTLVDDSTS